MNPEEISVSEEIKTSEENKNEKQENKSKKDSKKTKKYEDEIANLTMLLGAEKEKSMRIQAEMMNFKRRKEDEVASMYKYANEDILKKLVNIVDNFERALSLENEENKEFLKGFNMIYTNILNILTENEVKEIVCLNEPFDPTFHQAVLTETREGVEPGIVVEVLQKGYMYKDKVLRATMVKVSE